jgi:hypothetical protein
MTEYTEKRIATPKSFYEHPSHVLADQKLTVAEKRDVLESMKVDSQLLMRATAENMGGGEVNHLQDVEKALMELNSNEDQ